MLPPVGTYFVIWYYLVWYVVPSGLIRTVTTAFLLNWVCRWCLTLLASLREW